MSFSSWQMVPKIDCQIYRDSPWNNSRIEKCGVGSFLFPSAWGNRFTRVNSLALAIIARDAAAMSETDQDRRAGDCDDPAPSHGPAEAIDPARFRTPGG